MLESVKGLLIIVRGARLETMADLTGCRKIIAKGARGDSDRALVAYVPHMLVAREITALVRELVRAFKRQDDRGVKAVLDAYIPVWEHKLPPPDKGREDGSRGRPPKVSKQQREARRKAQLWTQEKRKAAAHTESVKCPGIERGVKAITGHIKTEGAPVGPDAKKGRGRGAKVR
jgi:hypothetical protein